jgi:hypothetical protein
MTATWVQDTVIVRSTPICTGKGTSRNCWCFRVRHGVLELVTFRREFRPTRRHKLWQTGDHVSLDPARNTMPWSMVPMTNELAQEILDVVTATLRVRVAGRAEMPSHGFKLVQAGSEVDAATA